MEKISFKCKTELRIKKKNYLFLFLVVLGFRCYAPTSSSCGEWGQPFIVVCWFLMAVASLAAEHGL